MPSIVRGQLHIVGLGRTFESGVKLLRRDFSLGDRGCAGFRLGLRPSGVGLGGNLAGLLVDEPAEPAPGDGRVLYRLSQTAADPFQGSRAQFQVAVFDLGVEGIPEAFHQALEQIQALAQATDALGLKQRFGKPHPQLQVFGLGGERLSAKLDDLRPVRKLAFTLPFALRGVVIFAARLFDLVEYGGVL